MDYQRILQDDSDLYLSDYSNSECDDYEPLDDSFDDDGDYQLFEDNEEEEESKSTKIVKPCVKINSPQKSSSPKTPPKSPSWWDKSKTIEKTNRLVNGVLNYAALLPPPQPKPKVKKQSVVPVSKVQKQSVPEVKKPTRFCLSIIKKTKCFHGSNCRFAHSYSELKECNFGEKCKKITVVKTNQDGTQELSNKNPAVICMFKHAKESKRSFLKRIPQQHTSPKK